MMNNLNICLEREEIDMLPVTAIKGNLVPILGNPRTAAETWHIQIGKHPSRTLNMKITILHFASKSAKCVLTHNLRPTVIMAADALM